MSEPLIVRYRALFLIVLALVMILDVLAIVQWLVAGRWPLSIVFVAALIVTYMMFGAVRDYGQVRRR